MKWTLLFKAHGVDFRDITPQNEWKRKSNIELISEFFLACIPPCILVVPLWGQGGAGAPFLGPFVA